MSRVSQYFHNFLTLLKFGESGGKATFNADELATTEEVQILAGSLGSAAGADVADFAPALTADQNYVSNTQLVVLGNTSGTNTGNETPTSMAALINGSQVLISPGEGDVFGVGVNTLLKQINWSNIKEALKLSFLGTVQTWTKGQVGEVTALTSTSASIAINLSDSNNFSHTFTENTTLAAPSNPVAGQSGAITLTQHVSSPKTLAYNTFWKFAGGTIPSVTTTNSAVDLLTYYVIDSGKAICNLIKGVA